MTTRAICLWLTIAATGSIQAQESKHESASQRLGIRFARIPEGTYRRGFDTAHRREHEFHLAHIYSNRQQFNLERPAHRVRISRPFEMAVTEVTVGQFRQFVAETGYVTVAEKRGGAIGCFPDEKDYVDRFHQDPSITWKTPGFAQTEAHPVVAVSWTDANSFCAWLSRKDGVTYRLPTEAEWEYACRAGTTEWYSWGRDPDEAYSHANVADAALEAAQPNTTRFQRAVRLKPDEGDGVVFTAAVASYKPNAWGLYDMHGNVWEWCQDRWSEDTYERLLDGVSRADRDQFEVRDPLFERETDQHRYGDWRVIRGGAWTCAPASVRCSIRTFAEAADAAVYTGFRLVRERP